MNNCNAFKPLTKDDVANVFDISLRTVENWLNAGLLPPPTKLGHRVYWHPGAFYAWLDHRLAVNAEAIVELHREPEPTRQAMPEKPDALTKPTTGKGELVKLRSRTQAQLDALVR